ncbi:MAG: hypothetical protein D6719_06605 [Candidatus Dadabacteria bacterium]|nr:MAG: hypothetical protein D6719_06605 [Candidatus Dadabacteria bacterium]
MTSFEEIASRSSINEGPEERVAADSNGLDSLVPTDVIERLRETSFNERVDNDPASFGKTPEEAFDSVLKKITSSGLSVDEFIEGNLTPVFTLSADLYRQILNELDAAIIQPATECSHSDVGFSDGSGRVADYHARSATDLPALFAQAGVYNTPFIAGAPRGYNMNIRWDELREVREKIGSYYRENPATVIFPFHREPGTISGNIIEGINTIGAENVLAVSTMGDPESEDRARQAVQGGAALLARQPEILAAIDWAQVSKMCCISPNPAGDHLPPPGAKGLTLLAGLLATHARGQLLERDIIFHDTDIVNPYDYAALHYLAVAKIFAEDQPHDHVLIAKTGPGRNNEAWTMVANLIAHDPRVNPDVRKMARVASSFIWPLSGERMMRGEDLYNMPFTNGMSIETQIDMFYAGRAVESGKVCTGQVCNGVRKEESESVSELREWALILRCAAWFNNVAYFLNDRGSLLHDLTIDDIAKFNSTIASIHWQPLLQSPTDSRQADASIYPDRMLPSLRQLDEHGLINWHYLRNLLDA